MEIKNIHIMKQPELGKKILELRKQKGFTQEELVEMCNINVRTIQRIEAGEVSPRSYTIKTILEALGVNYENVIETKFTAGKFDKILGINIDKARQQLNIAFIFGIIYFVFGYIEVASEYQHFNEEALFFSTTIYIIIKLISIISFTLFIRGFVIAGNIYRSHLLEIMAFLLIILNILSGMYDITSLFIFQDYIYYGIISKIIIFGVVGILLGVGVLKLQEHFGSLALVTGIFQILTGFLFTTVVLTIVGLFTMLPMELLEIVLLYKIYSSLKSKELYS